MYPFIFISVRLLSLNLICVCLPDRMFIGLYSVFNGTLMNTNIFSATGMLSLRGQIQVVMLNKNILNFEELKCAESF